MCWSDGRYDTMRCVTVTDRHRNWYRQHFVIKYARVFHEIYTPIQDSQNQAQSFSHDIDDRHSTKTLHISTVNIFESNKAQLISAILIIKFSVSTASIFKTTELWISHHSPHKGMMNNIFGICRFSHNRTMCNDTLFTVSGAAAAAAAMTLHK